MKASMQTKKTRENVQICRRIYQSNHTKRKNLHHFDEKKTCIGLKRKKMQKFWFPLKIDLAFKKSFDFAYIISNIKLAFLWRNPPFQFA